MATLPTVVELKLAELNAGTWLGMPQLNSKHENVVGDQTPLCWQNTMVLPMATKPDRQPRKQPLGNVVDGQAPWPLAGRAGTPQSTGVHVTGSLAFPLVLFHVPSALQTKAVDPEATYPTLHET